jgi:hypothetical protein
MLRVEIYLWILDRYPGKINENSMSLEILNFLLMLFGFFESLERSEVASFSSRHVFFTGIKAILARFQFTYHASVDALRIRLDVFAELPSMLIKLGMDGFEESRITCLCARGASLR